MTGLHRFVQIGDLHLGPKPRNDERIAALDQILDEQLQTPVAAWLWPGDLNDGRMTISDKNALVARVTRMAHHAPVVACYGNHDIEGDLDFLEHLDAAYPILVVKTPRVVELRTATGANAAIFVFPYPHKHGFVAAGVQPLLVHDAAMQALEPIFISAADELRKLAVLGYLPLMIGHVNVGGSIASTGQPNIGREIELSPLLLQRLGPIYIGLNHIHRAQQVDCAFYAGSCCRLDWGECEPKEYVVVTYGPGTWGGHAGDGPYNGCADYTWDVEHRPIDVAPMYHAEGELTRDAFTWTVPTAAIPLAGTIGVHAPPLDPLPIFAGAEVRVRYTFNADDKAALTFDLVKRPFAGAKRIVEDPIALHTRATRAPEVAAAKTLEDKVKAYYAQAGLPWSDDLLAKLAALQHPDKGTFLSDLTTALDAGALDAAEVA